MRQIYCTGLLLIVKCATAVHYLSFTLLACDTGRTATTFPLPINSYETMVDGGWWMVQRSARAGRAAFRFR